MRHAFRKQDYIDIMETATWLVFQNPLTCRPGYLDEILEEIYEAVESAEFGDFDDNIVEKLFLSSVKHVLKELGLLSYPGFQDMNANNYVVLVSRELGVAVLPDLGYAFAIPGNRFFRKRKAAKDSFAELVFENSLPHDVAMYIQKHSLLPEACIGASQSKAVGRQIVQDYIAFWIGFYRELHAYGNAPNFEHPDAAEEITDTPSLFD